MRTKMEIGNGVVFTIVLLIVGSVFFLNAQENKADYSWQLAETGEIVWNLDSKNALPHDDHIAMSGQFVDMILEWGLDESGSFYADRLIRWPMLRTLPDDTHASLQRKLGDTVLSRPRVNGDIVSAGKVEKIKIHGFLSVVSEHAEGLKSERTIFPSVLNPVIIDRIKWTNTSNRPMEIMVPAWKNEEHTDADKGFSGSYVISEFVVGDGKFRLAVGESVTYAVVRAARKSADAPYFGNSLTEWAARQEFIRNSSNNLVLETPDLALNRLFDFSKIRASESIFSTRGGLMHGPGGYNKYLAAIWANDQAEYVNPFFPFLGDPAGNESALNSFRHFARYSFINI